MPTTAEEQLAFLSKIQRLLTDGQFTATYKYALLLALADLAVELRDETGPSLNIRVEQIAEKFIQYYWRHVVPYIPSQDTGMPVVLQQNTDRQAAVINAVRRAREQHGDSLTEFRLNSKAWNALVRRVERVLWEQPLWRLQRIGTQSLDFLYVSRRINTRVASVELLPGVASCLRQFHPLITDLVRSAWIQYVRKYNQSALGSTTDLGDFLFGSERGRVALLRPVLMDLQCG